MSEKLNNSGLYRILGIMSGTSLDGIDFCLVQFDPKNVGNFQVESCATHPYTEAWQARLQFKRLSAWELQELDRDFTNLLSSEVLKFIDDHGIKPGDIDAIASHGHTWFHQPEVNITLQIGNGPGLNIATAIPIVCDFRRADVCLGGQGAPLVPIGDRDLFANYEACINLGGFINISHQRGEARLAFDIAPLNIVMNQLATQLGKNYDPQGRLASEGQLDQDLLNNLNALAYYQQSPPKSLGVEWVRQHILPLLKNSSPHNALRTFSEHAAQQVARVVDQKKLRRVLLSGGGVYNQFFIERLKNLAPNVDWQIPSSTIINYKEALIFAYLGLLRILEKPNILASVTGAKEDHCSGTIHDLRG